jgi:hypothetical protein
VVGEREVVVRAQVDQFAAVCQADNGLLRRAEHALGLEEALRPEVVTLAGEAVEEWLVQAGASVAGRDYKAPIIGP